MADDKKNGNNAREKFIAKQEGTYVPKAKESMLQKRFVAEAERRAERQQAESAARMAKSQAEMHHNDATTKRISGFAEQLNKALVDGKPSLQGRFHVGSSADGKPALIFEKPEGNMADANSLQAEAARVARAFGMVNTATLNNLLFIAADPAGAVCISSAGSKAADFPLIPADTVATCLLENHAGKYLSVCVDIDAYNRRTPKGEHPLKGDALWSEFRKRHPEQTLIDNTALGGARFDGYDLSGLTFGPGAIVKNSLFYGTDVSSADFSRVRGTEPAQFDGMIAAAGKEAKLPSFAARVASQPSAPAPVTKPQAHRPDLKGIGENTGDAVAEQLAAEFLNRFNGGNPGKSR